jgi:hypothetical protein
LTVPPDLNPDRLEPHRNLLQLELDRLSQAAESWAETGILDKPSRIIQSQLVVPAIQQPQRTVQAEVGVGREWEV